MRARLRAALHRGHLVSPCCPPCLIILLRCFNAAAAAAAAEKGRNMLELLLAKLGIPLEEAQRSFAGEGCELSWAHARGLGRCGWAAGAAAAACVVACAGCGLLRIYRCRCCMLNTGSACCCPLFSYCLRVPLLPPP